MKIEEQVLSIEQMKHLQELGVDTSDASMVWIKKDSIIFPDDMKELWWVDVYCDSLKPMVEQEDSGFVQTYTAGDLIRKLPSSLKNEWLSSFLSISTDGCEEPFYSVCYEEEFNNIKGRQTGERVEDALYNLLCWVAENHKELLEVKK